MYTLVKRREGEDDYLTRGGGGMHIERRRRVVDRTRGKLGTGDMEGKRVGERTRGHGRKRKKESRACE